MGKRTEKPEIAEGIFGALVVQDEGRFVIQLCTGSGSVWWEDGDPIHPIWIDRLCSVLQQAKAQAEEQQDSGI